MIDNVEDLRLVPDKDFERLSIPIGLVNRIKMKIQPTTSVVSPYLQPHSEEEGKKPVYKAVIMVNTDYEKYPKHKSWPQGAKDTFSRAKEETTQQLIRLFSGYTNETV